MHCRKCVGAGLRIIVIHAIFMGVDGKMLDVVKGLLQCRSEKKDTILVGIMESSGSLPRKKGAYMLVGDKGRIAGTVGGGNLEYQAIAYAVSLFDQQKTGSLQEKTKYSVLSYELNLGESAELGMVCGGRAKLLFYPVYWAEPGLEPWILNWKEALEQGKEHQLVFYDLSSDRKDRQETSYDNLPLIYQERIFGGGTVYLFGAGHLAREVVPLLAHLDFRCVVLDDREEFANPSDFPGAKEVKLVDFERLETAVSPKEGDYLVIMTRGHQWDFYAEVFGLKTDADYIGVVGSRKKTAFVNEKLRKMGFTEADVARIVTPIGLDIGSETPAEIAISIAAQLIEVRAKKRRRT